MLEDEPDFKSQKYLVIEELEKRGHAGIYLPKFHPELSAAEPNFADVEKYLTERNIPGNSVGFTDRVESAFQSLDLGLVRKRFLRCWKIAEWYMKPGITGENIYKEIAAAKKSHRTGKTPFDREIPKQRRSKRK